MTGLVTHSDVEPAAAPSRDRVIPLRKSELLQALLADGRLGDTEREPLRRFARMLGAVFHYEYFDELERLREAYFHFNPDIAVQRRDDGDGLEQAYADLDAELARVLDRANFVEVPHEEIARAHAECATVPVKLRVPLDEFREVRIFRRGHHRETVEIPSWLGLRRRPAEVDVYDDVVLMVAARPEAAADGGGAPHRKNGRGRRKIRPGAVLFKYFRHIASADLNALFPNARVVMSLYDQLFLGVPAVVGGIPILIKLASTVTVLFIVAGFYLGLSHAVRDEDIKGALAALGGLVALGAFAARQWSKFNRQSLLHQKQLTDNVYYRNLNNNAGVFDYLVGAAEEQEWKEALLAYHALLTAPSPLPRAAIEAGIEDWLKRGFALTVDFEIGDALAKLTRLDLLIENGDRFSVPPLAEALARLDRAWDSYFAPAAPLTASAAE
jgi:Protein of unknown function (DUF3754)